VTISTDLTKVETRCGGRLRPRGGRGGRRGRRDEGDIDALPASFALSSQIRYDLSKIVGAKFTEYSIKNEKFIPKPVGRRAS
jgi:hypothetical protein